MASILTYDPGSSEAQSPLIAGLTEGLNKLSTILDMNTSTIENSILSSVQITETDKNRIYQANMGNRLWLSNPAPVFKKNGNVIKPETDGFSIDYVGGSISFQGNNRLQDSDVVTVSCTYIIPSSKVIESIQSSITVISGLTSKNKGTFNTESDLNSNVPSASNGDFAIVLSVPSVFLWANNAWMDSSHIDKFGDYYTKSEIDTIVSAKEPAISTQGENVSADDYYYGGRKTWQNVNAKVRETTLTGLSTTSSDDITSSDTVLSGLGKLQSQNSDIKTKTIIRKNETPSESTVGYIGQRYVNTSNGNWYVCTAINGNAYTWTDYVSTEYFENEINGLNIPEIDARVTENETAIANTQTIATQAQQTAQSALVELTSIDLTTTWSTQDNVIYTQTVTLQDATPTINSKIDLQPDETQFKQLIDDGVGALFIENNNGSLTAYAIGAAPSVELAIQCTKTEVSR